MNEEAKDTKLLSFVDDLLDRKDLSDNLTNDIKAFASLNDEAFVLSLNAPFGAGKTTFLRMWQNGLVKEEIKCVYINAWEQDFEEDPLVPILSELLDKISDKEPLKGAIQKAGRAVVQISKEFVKSKTGVDINNISDNELFEAYKDKKDALKELKDSLQKYVENPKNKPLIIFVDELDRARPNYTVEFLERIKHIFSVPSICFVLAVDREQLEKSVRHLYGDIDFESYYLRFVSDEASLPDITSRAVARLIDKISRESENKIESANKTHRFKDIEDTKNNLTDMCKRFNLNARQMERFGDRFYRTFSTNKENAFKTLPQWLVVTAILTALSLVDINMYRRIGTGNISLEETLAYLISVFTEDQDMRQKIRMRDVSSEDILGYITKSDLNDNPHSYFYHLALIFSLNQNNERKVCEFYQKHFYTSSSKKGLDLSKQGNVSEVLVNLMGTSFYYDNYIKTPKTRSLFNHIYGTLEFFKRY